MFARTRLIVTLQYIAFIVFTVVMKLYIKVYVWRLSESRLFHVL